MNDVEMLARGILKFESGYYFHPAEIQRAMNSLTGMECAYADSLAAVIATLLTRALDAEDRLRAEPQRPIVLVTGDS